MKIKKYLNSIKIGEAIYLWVSRAIIIFVILVILFPVIWIVSSSFSKGDTFLLSTLIPKQLTFSNYSKIIIEENFLIWLRNSAILCLSVALIQLITSTLGAYAFARMRFRFRRYGIMILFMIQIFPATMSVAAVYLISYRLNLINNIFALIFILSAGSAFSIWLLKNYIDTIPREFDEAAMMDGANHFQILIKVIVPLIKPMLAVIFLFSFTGVYSEYILTSIIIQSPEYHTIPLGMLHFIKDTYAENWTMYSAGSVMASLPIMVLFGFLQKYIQGGLAASGVKG